MTAARKLAREYELVYILRPTVSPAEARKVADRVSDVIAKEGAKLTRVDNWGKRKLAYTIKTSAGRFTRGIFIYVKFAGYDGLVAELERNLRLLDDCIRFQTIRLETLYELGELEVDPEEIAFRDIETSEEEDEDPSFEETLGMKPRSSDRDASDSGEGRDRSDDDDDDDSDGDDDDDDDSSDEEE